MCIKAFRDPLYDISGMYWLKNLVELLICVFSMFVGWSSMYLASLVVLCLCVCL